MSTGKWVGTRPTDIDRMIRCAQKRGLPIGGLETLKDGRVRLIVGQPSKRETSDPSGELDNWMTKHARQVEGH